MLKSILIGFFFLIVMSSKAQDNVNDDTSKTTSLFIQPKVGYSISKISFNIAGNELGTNPNVLSELIWDPTNSLEYGVDLGFTHKKFVIKADVLISKTLFGDVSDIDYDGDNRTLPYSTLYLSNHKGLGYSLKLQPGYNWSNNERVSLVTFLSFDYSGRTLYLLNDKDWRTNDRNYISGLNSYYKYKFPSYGLGVNLDYEINNNWSTEIALEGYLSKYKAYGNWNLIEDFEKPISYEHKGNGKRLATSLGLAYTFSEITSLRINYNLNHFAVRDGKDYLYSKDDGLLKARLNDANETKHAFFLNLRFNLPLAN